MYKRQPQEDASEPGQETAPAQAEKPSMTDFKPYVGRKRKSGTGCISEINDHLFEGRYSPKWPDGKKHARNVYAHTREECEEKLKALIVEMKAEIAEIKAGEKATNKGWPWRSALKNCGAVGKENILFEKVSDSVL